MKLLIRHERLARSFHVNKMSSSNCAVVVAKLHNFQFRWEQQKMHNRCSVVNRMPRFVGSKQTAHQSVSPHTVSQYIRFWLCLTCEYLSLRTWPHPHRRTIGCCIRRRSDCLWYMCAYQSAQLYNRMDEGDDISSIKKTVIAYTTHLRFHQVTMAFLSTPENNNNTTENRKKN